MKLAYQAEIRAIQKNAQSSVEFSFLFIERIPQSPLVRGFIFVT